MSYYPESVLYPEGPDWEDPEEERKRPWNCRKCGRFVSKEPVIYKVAIRDVYLDFETDKWVSGPDDIWEEYHWICGSCGEEYKD
jgi:hypothetical protein